MGIQNEEGNKHGKRVTPPIVSRLSASGGRDHVEKRKRIIMESVYRAKRIKCEINLIGEARSKISPLVRGIGSNA